MESFSLGHRAAYRRVLAVLKAQSVPFVVAGALGLSVYLAQVLDGDLEIFVRPDDAPVMLAAMSASGFRVRVDDDRGDATVEYAGLIVKVAWRLPPPLGGHVDDAWFGYAVRRHLFGLRVRIAPPEELLWMRIAAPQGPPRSLPDPLVDALLVEHGAKLQWDRLLGRLAGLEALTLAHIFLFRHRHPDAARAVPMSVQETLQRRMNAAAGESVENAIH